MKLIIGLGNPGLKYQNTWHNLGFLAIDNFRQEQKFGAWKKNNKFPAEISTGKINGEKIILAKPLTFMNNSGWAVKATANYYKIKAADLIVVHDDIDLPLGKIRLAKNSSAGGHNGVKSIIDNLKTPDFVRVKIGILTDKTKLIDAADYVLKKFSRAQNTVVKASIKKTASALEAVITENLERAMNEYN